MAARRGQSQLLAVNPNLASDLRIFASSLVTEEVAEDAKIRLKSARSTDRCRPDH
jgi:hypothetical protein